MINHYLLCMLLSVSVASVSQILLKKSTCKSYDSVIREYLNPWVIGGYGMLFLSMIISIYAYSGVDYKMVLSWKPWGMCSFRFLAGFS